jgi:hypothetical protein
MDKRSEYSLTKEDVQRVGICKGVQHHLSLIKQWDTYAH